MGQSSLSESFGNLVRRPVHQPTSRWGLVVVSIRAPERQVGTHAIPSFPLAQKSSPYRVTWPSRLSALLRDRRLSTGETLALPVFLSETLIVPPTRGPPSRLVRRTSSRRRLPRRLGPLSQPPPPIAGGYVHWPGVLGALVPNVAVVLPPCPRPCHHGRG